MCLSEAPQGRHKFRSTSGTQSGKQTNGFKQVFFLFKTVSFISHCMAAPTYPTDYLTATLSLGTIGTVRLYVEFNMKKKALPREDRLRQILLCFAMELQEGRTGEMTIADIAKKMHLSVSTKLRLMVEELVIDSQIISTKESIPGVAKFRRVYRPNLGEFKQPRPQYRGAGRSIRINSKQQSFFAEVE